MAQSRIKKSLRGIYGYGQRTRSPRNYLTLHDAADNIIQTALIPTGRPSDLAQTVVVEIDGGVGSLTRSILKLCPKAIIAIEKEVKFLPIQRHLAELAPCPMRVISGDGMGLNLQKILSEPFPTTNTTNSLPKPLVSACLEDAPTSFDRVEIVASPILTNPKPIIFKYLYEWNSMGMTILLHQDLARRMLSACNTEDRCKFSVFVQSLCQPISIGPLEKYQFIPKAKVKPFAIRLEPLSQPFENPTHLLGFLTYGFYRISRSIESNLLRLYSKESIHSWFDQVKVDPNMTPLSVPTSVWKDLAKLALEGHPPLASETIHYSPSINNTTVTSALVTKIPFYDTNPNMNLSK